MTVSDIARVIAPEARHEIVGIRAGIADAMARSGAGLVPGALHVPGFAQALGKVMTDAADPRRLDEMSRNAAAICDGKGAARVMERFGLKVLHAN